MRLHPLPNSIRIRDGMDCRLRLIIANFNILFGDEVCPTTMSFQEVSEWQWVLSKSLYAKAANSQGAISRTTVSTLQITTSV